jgi:hypothetical protein
MSGGAEVSDVAQGECDAADGGRAVAAQPLRVAPPAAQNDGVAPGAEIQQVNNEQAHSAAHPTVRLLHPQSHTVCSAGSIPTQHQPTNNTYQLSVP